MGQFNPPVIRQWGPATFAVYLDLGDRYPTFVGIESTTSLAEEFALSVMADPDECSKRRCSTTDFGAELGHSEHLFVGQFEGESDGPECLNTPARLAPDNAGATP